MLMDKLWVLVVSNKSKPSVSALGTSPLLHEECRVWIDQQDRAGRPLARHGGYAMWIDAAGFQKSLAALPLATCQAGETVLTDGSRTGRLLILKTGNVVVVKEGVEIATVTEPGTVSGEISALLDCPH